MMMRPGMKINAILELHPMEPEKGNSMVPRGGRGQMKMSPGKLYPLLYPAETKNPESPLLSGF